MRGQKSVTIPFNISALRAYSLLAIFYVLLIFFLPANHQTLGQYHLTALEYHVLLFTIILPSIAVWFAAFYGYAKLQEYADSITKAPESADFGRLARGAGWLAWSLPVPAIIGLLVDTIANAHPAFHSTAVILNDYLNLLLPLIAFSIIGSAARSLIGHAKVHFTESSIRVSILILVAGGVLYCYLTFRQFDSTSLGSADNPYYLPVWLVLLTITVPYLYTWFVGWLAAYDINTFSKHVPGLFYRQPLRLMVGGLTAVITSFIALQYIGSIEPQVGHLLLNYKLVLTSSFHIIGSIGYLLIALGANRLKKIEEV